MVYKLSGIFLIVIICGVIFNCLAENREEERVPNINVSGVIFDGKEPVAIVNGEILKEGDSIEGYKILKIMETEVEFEYKGEIFVRVIGAKTIGFTPQPVPRYKKKSVIKEMIDAKSFNKEQAVRELKKLRGALQYQFYKMIRVIWLIFIGAYIYISITLQKIAGKTGTKQGWLAWIPGANLYLLCLIAGRPWWWLLLLFIPYLNVIIIIILWAGIARARNKPGWLGGLMILPVVNFIIIGYLAFSNGIIKEQRIKKENIVRSIDSNIQKKSGEYSI